MVNMEIFVQAGKRAQRLRESLVSLSFWLREVEVHDHGSVININLGVFRIGLRVGDSPPWIVEPNSKEARERARLLIDALPADFHKRMDVSGTHDVRVTNDGDLIKVIAYLLGRSLGTVLFGQTIQVGNSADCE